MILQRSHAWTPLQKRLIVAGVITAVAAFGGLIYSYERYHRGPTDSVLFGTWESAEAVLGLGSISIYYRLNPDHTFQVLSRLDDEQSVFARGRWRAGGKFVYLNLSWEGGSERKLIIWRIEGISPNSLQIRYNPGGRLHTYKRVSGASSEFTGAKLRWPHLPSPGYGMAGRLKICVPSNLSAVAFLRRQIRAIR